MTPFRFAFFLVLATLLSAHATPVRASDGVAEAIDQAIEAAVAATESRVVQLRYFGAGSGSLGAAAAPVTGFDLGDGWVLTSTYGLASDPAGILCRFADGSQEQARLVGRDTGRRLALLSVREAGRAPPQPVAPGRASRVGETAIALGRVYDAVAVQRSVGVVSAVGRFGGRALQTDALASPTNYGGPLIGLDGSLRGLLTPLSPAGQKGVSLYDSGVGFAVPPSQIDRSLRTLAEGRDLHPGWLGVSFVKGNPLVTPATVRKVTPDGPAKASGIAVDDRLVSLAGEPTPSLWRLRAILAGLDAGQTVRVVVANRAGNRRELGIELGEKPAAPASPEGAEALGLEMPTK